MQHQLSSMIRFACGLLLVGAGGLVADVGTVAAAPLTPPVTSPTICSTGGNATTTIITTGATVDLKLPCAPQSGQIFIVVIGRTSPDANQAPATVPPTGVTDTPTDQMTGVADPRVDSYAKRQAIRD